MRDHWTFTSHAGFALIEWVVVTLVGIVASFAIPRFTRLDRSVREIRSVRYRTVCGNVRSTARLQPQNGRFYSAGNPFFVSAGYSWFKKSV